MGFIRGTQGMVLREALMKDPIELFLKGYRVSVRRAEAQQIHVEELK
jgi:Fe2+ transport system protein FeoA